MSPYRQIWPSVAHVERNATLAWMRRSIDLAVLALLTLFSCAAHAGIDTGVIGDDARGGPFQIGFEFHFYGKAYTQFSLSSNGVLALGRLDSTGSNQCLGED